MMHGCPDDIVLHLTTTIVHPDKDLSTLKRKNTERLGEPAIITGQYPDLSEVKIEYREFLSLFHDPFRIISEEPIPVMSFWWTTVGRISFISIHSRMCFIIFTQYLPVPSE